MYTYLTEEQERDLLDRMLQGDQAARHELVLSHKRMVYRIVQHFPTTLVARDDLIQEGMLGLVRAASRWDGTSETRFAGYARKWCWDYVKRAFYRERLVSQFVEPDNDGRSLERLVWDTQEPSAVSTVRAAISGLCPFESWVIRRRYRIGERDRVGDLPARRSQGALARRCGLTTVRVYRAERRALRRLRRFLARRFRRWSAADVKPVRLGPGSTSTARSEARDSRASRTLGR
jgi:RNA polymerase sigma factor (sigma-70 family)